jgi:hypothetical protein
LPPPPPPSATIRRTSAETETVACTCKVGEIRHRWSLDHSAHCSLILPRPNRRPPGVKTENRLSLVSLYLHFTRYSALRTQHFLLRPAL